MDLCPLLKHSLMSHSLVHFWLFCFERRDVFKVAFSNRGDISTSWCRRSLKKNGHFLTPEQLNVITWLHASITFNLQVETLCIVFRWSSVRNVWFSLHRDKNSLLLKHNLYLENLHHLAALVCWLVSAHSSRSANSSATSPTCRFINTQVNKKYLQIDDWVY